MRTSKSGKIVLVGSENVGKTSLVYRLHKNQFSTQYSSTIGAEYRQKKVNVNDSVVELNFWDTTGHRKFDSILPMWIRGANIGLICVNEWDESQVNGYISKFSVHAENAKILIVMTKVDRHEESQDSNETIHHYLAKKFCDLNGYTYCPTSAKYNKGVDELVDICVKHIYELPDKVQSSDLPWFQTDKTRTTHSSFRDCCNLF